MKGLVNLIKMRSKVNKNATRGIIWEEPPKISSKWMERLKPLIEYPHRWSRVHESNTKAVAQTTVYKLRKGELNIPRDCEFEFTYHNEKIYAKFLGKKKGLLQTALNN